MPVKLLAAALPQAASTVGDRRGDLIGRTAGTCRRPVFLDLHFPMEVRERSGLAVFVAEPGGGKSTLVGALGYLAKPFELSALLSLVQSSLSRSQKTKTRGPP